MFHPLTGRRPDVHPDIVAVGRIPLIQQPTGIVDERQKGGLLGPGHLKERGHVPEGDCEEDDGGAGGAEGAGGGVTCHIYDPIERGLILFPSEHRS